MLFGQPLSPSRAPLNSENNEFAFLLIEMRFSPVICRWREREEAIFRNGVTICYPSMQTVKTAPVVLYCIFNNLRKNSEYMELYTEFFKIITRFRKENIRYAVIGGIALAFHDVPRFTRDIDFLTLPEDMDEIKKIMSGLGYSESAEPWSFKKTKLTLHRFAKIRGKDHVLVDVMTGGEPRHRKIIEESIAAESRDGAVSVASRDDLIWMKGLRNSEQDKVDIKNLKNDKD